MMSYYGGLSKKRLFCFLIVLASSVMCYVIVTSPTVPGWSSVYERHAYNTQGRCLHMREWLQNLTNCSCSKDVDDVLYDTDDYDAKDMGQNSTLHNLTTWTNSNGSHLLLPKKGKTIMNSSLTGHLWNFKDIGDQQLYLYEKLLKKWSANLTKADILRQELAKYRSELDGNSQLILHQKNVKVGEGMKFVFGGKAKAMTSSVFKYLPKTNPLPQGPRYRSCAVVGNSGIMLNSGCGKDIDKHDFVFRCNLAPLSPFIQDAGMKNNFTTMNPSMLSRYYHNLGTTESVLKYNDDISQYDGVIWIPCYHFGAQLPLVLKAISKFTRQKPKMVCGNPVHFKSVVNFWMERELNQRLSSGFYLVTTALQLCDEVQLYGFWPFSTRYGDDKREVPYHYFDDLSASEAFRVHAMDKEFSLLVQLHTLGVLRLNIGSCS